MGRKRRQGNNISKTNNNILVDLVEIEGDESLDTNIRRMIRMFNELEEI
jgi:hypothetical protein